MKMLDLFSGLGGASEAMIQDPKWEVQRIENNVLLESVPGTTLKSVFELRDELVKMELEGYRPSTTIDLVWASPPCVEFSLAYSSPQSIALREEKQYQPDLRAVEATIEIIRILKPRYWVIENVRGAVNWFKPLLGKQAKVINHSIFMWGNFPAFVNPEIDSKEKGAGSSSDPLRANKRAIIPFAVSQELKNAIENQKQIWDYVSLGHGEVYR
jgi:site-specific DNA-cytosine methylase